LLLHTHDDGSRIARSVRELQDQGCDVRLAFGPLDEQSLREIHRSVHFVVNPAVWEEPGSSTVIEGLFFGTPAIVPSQTGSADFVKPGANGYHYQFRDVDDLLEKLRTAVEEVGGWRHLHEGALQSARHYRRLSDLHVEMLYERLFNRH
ncbi:MAG TPA: glycosyltransferase, partial [Anaeromyxobacteraceae bacterium]|nr:glycosyltransferase [Anaeromyxobacteraceae bacterium]